MCSFKFCIREDLKDEIMSVRICSYFGKGLKLHHEKFRLGIRIDSVVKEVID